ncbi:hypothetical protein G8765_14730 [Janthinobacterium lividum]|nr:hypothetical protein [Janthinobacterium lividum]QKY08885.1 hypothetical protein G8765_14730 [Janthinobacterium lividum]
MQQVNGVRAVFAAQLRPAIAASGEQVQPLEHCRQERVEQHQAGVPDAGDVRRICSVVHAFIPSVTL